MCSSCCRIHVIALLATLSSFYAPLLLALLFEAGLPLHTFASLHTENHRQRQKQRSRKRQAEIASTDGAQLAFQGEGAGYVPRGCFGGDLDVATYCARPQPSPSTPPPRCSSDLRGVAQVSTTCACWATQAIGRWYKSTGHSGGVRKPYLPHQTPGQARPRGRSFLPSTNRSFLVGRFPHAHRYLPRANLKQSARPHSSLPSSLRPSTLTEHSTPPSPAYVHLQPNPGVARH